MARLKTVKKNVSFVKGTLINRVISDRAELENRSDSAIIEDILLNTLLPQNKQARAIVENYLYSDNGSIKTTLAAIFANNAAGINWNSVNDNLLPLVQYVKKHISSGDTVFNEDAESIVHMYSQIDSVITRLESSGVQAEASQARLILQKIKEEKNIKWLDRLCQLILDNWDELKNWTITYRLLADVVRVTDGWIYEAKNKTELLALIQSISAEWK